MNTNESVEFWTLAFYLNAIRIIKYLAYKWLRALLVRKTMEYSRLPTMAKFITVHFYTHNQATGIIPVANYIIML